MKMEAIILTILITIILLLVLSLIIFLLFKNRIQINSYIQRCDEISKRATLYSGKLFRAKNRGIIGERKVESIIRKYTDKYYSNVVISGRKEKLFTEMDYIIPVHDRLELIEVKAWYGKLSIEGNDSIKVEVSLRNHAGKYVTYERDNPFLTISFFRTDLGQYYSQKHNLGLIKGMIDRTIVFSRDSFDFSELKETYADKEVNIFNLDEFEKHLSKLKSEGAFENQTLKYRFPTWDKFYDQKLNKWFDTVVLNKNIDFNEKTVPAQDIEALLFKEDNVIVKYRSSKIEKLHLDINLLKFNLPQFVKKSNIAFIRFNKVLHEI